MFRYLVPVVFALAFVLLPSRAAAAGKTRIDIGFWGSGDYSCDSTYSTVYYTGGEYDLTVTLLPEGTRAGVEYTGITDWTWPAGLIIRAARSLHPAEEFHASYKLWSDLQFQYYVTATQAKYDSAWKANGQSPPRGRTAPEYHFKFVVPDDMANSFLCLSVEWNHPVCGLLESEKPICAKIVVPCSRTARDMKWASLVSRARRQGQHDLAIALADSFIAQGWTNVWGLALASLSAMDAERYDAALRYLDLNFEANHTIFYPEGSPPAEETPRMREIYLQAREKVVRLKNQQQQH